MECGGKSGSRRTRHRFLGPRSLSFFVCSVWFVDKVKFLEGTVTPDATIKVGDRIAQRLGERFFAVVSVDNEVSALRTNIVVTAFRHDPLLNKDIVACTTGVLFVAKASETPAYDNNASMVTDSRFTYSWDAFGRLTGAVNEVVPKTRLSFAYYPDGRRARKTVYRLSGQNWLPVRSHQFFYDGWNLASEIIDAFDATGNLLPGARVVRRCLWGLDLAGQRSGSLGQEAGGIGGLLAFTVTSNSVEKVYLPIADAMGNIHKVVDATTGAVAAEYDYDPFGKLVSDSLTHSRNNELTNFPFSCPFRFQSKYYDAETGLYYFGYRYYDPASCKWLCRDPLQEQGGINLTAYCSNDPVNKVDPLGLADLRNHVFVGVDALRELGIEMSLKDYESFARGLMLPDLPCVDVKGIASGRAEIPIAVLMTLNMELSKITKQVTESVKLKKEQLQQLYPILDLDDFRRWVPVAVRQMANRAAEPARRTAYWWGDSGIMGPVLTRVPKLRNTRTVRTHFADLTYYHGMGVSGGSAAELNDNIQTTVQTCLNEFRRLRQTDPSRAYLNLGIAIHILTDTWTPSHVTRNENGSIRLFQDYNAQSLHYHARNDNLIENVPQSYADAVTQSAQLIRLAMGSDAVDTSKFFNLAPGGRIGIVPGTGYVTFWETLLNGIPGGDK